MVYEAWPSAIQYRIQDYPGDGYTCLFWIAWRPGMAGDFRDIRFSDGNDTTLQYFIMSPSNFGTIPVRVKLRNSSTVYLHYGNGAAVSESNGTGMFLIFDDFNDGVVDTTNNWTLTGSPTESGTNITFAAGQGIISKTSFGVNYLMEFRAQISATSTSCTFRLDDCSTGDISMFDNDDSSASQLCSRSMINYTGYETKYYGSTYTTNWNVYRIARVGTSSVKFYINDALVGTHTLTIPDSAQKVNLGASNSYVYIDWVLVRPYLAIEPTAVYVTSGAKSLNASLYKFPHQLTGEAGSFIPLIRMRVTPGLEFFADSDIFMALPKLGATRIRGQSRPSAGTTGPGMFCHVLELGSTRNPLVFNRASGIFSEILESLCALTHADWSREARISTRIYSKGERELAFSRNSGSYVQENEELCTRINDYFRSRESNISIPAPLISVTRLHHLDHTADLEVPAPALKVEKWIGTPYVRLSELEVLPVSASGSWGGAFGRSADLQVPAVNGLAERSYGKQREASTFIPTLYLSASPFSGLEVTADCNIPILQFAAGRGIVNFRQVSSEILPLNIDVRRNGEFHRNSDIFVTIIETIGERQILTERITESFLGPISMDASRLADLVREASSEITEPCIIAICAINYGNPTAPFNIGLEKNSYEITVTPLEFGLTLSKNLFYAVIRDGESMIELTQYDTDTLYASLQDTDPNTGELRAMPLTGKTVKAVLKGGNPTTTVTVDCTATGAPGQVRCDLSSADTAVPGQYILKLVVLGTDFRKELPDSKDDYQLLTINDASYAL